MTDTRSEPRFTLGDNIRRARKDAGKEQRELAELVGCSNQVISKWERDKSVPDFVSMRKIIEALNAPWLLTEPFRSDNMPHSGYYGGLPVAA